MVVTVHEIIIDRNFSSAEEFTVPAIIAEIEPSTASSILQLLSDRLPLQLFGLGHLKRIRGRTNGSSASRRQQRSKAKNVHAEAGAINELPQEEGAAVEDRRLQIVICSQSNFDLVPEDIKGLLGETFKTAPVPRFCPNSHKEMEAWGVYWPLIYRPNEEDKLRERGFTQEQIDSVGKFMQLTIEDSRRRLERESSGFGSTDQGGAIVVNPNTNEVVMTASNAMTYFRSIHGDSALTHPLFTPVMLCINGVGATLRGDFRLPAESTSAAVAEEDQRDRTDVRDGHEEKDANSDDGDDVEPYLCSGLDLFVHVEPDLMSSMAMVHSRIRRVYFCTDQPTTGALASNCHLHSLSSLNHHYKVFRVSL